MEGCWLGWGSGSWGSGWVAVAWAVIGVWSGCVVAVGDVEVVLDDLAGYGVSFVDWSVEFGGVLWVLG